MINLYAKFDLINRVCFDGELHSIYVGFKAHRGKDAVFIDSPGNCLIELNGKYKKDENGLEAMLLHEMVHFWMSLNRKPKEEHDDCFKEKLAEVQKIWYLYKLKSL